jgi:N-dimethylarginine dimethylaminohydrolase
MVVEMDAFYEVLQKYNVTIFRPELIADYNQIFTRDIGFVIDGILLNRIFCLSERELDAIQYVIDQIDAMKVVRPPDEVHRRRDVMLWDDHIFIGTYKGSDYKDYITARTNREGVQFIKSCFRIKS